jgi:UDP-N-acetylmuramoyl-L-alanyl-D-glutamate--2,6-diaminopimelate ligase
MRLKELSAGCLRLPSRIEDLDVTGISSDSREVKPGYLFIAVPGEKTHGKRFARAAEKAGAVAVVGEGSGSRRAPGTEDRPDRIPFLEVKDARLALGDLAARFYGRVAERLQVAGITGTKGKTTTAWILDSILRSAGKVTALFGTVHHRVGPRTYPSENTTPGCLYLHGRLNELAGEGGTHAVLEVSSHGILQQRTAGIPFRCGIFTNVAPEHLDYHKTFESYVETKMRFFTDLAPGAFAVIPRDEAASARISARTRARVVWYGSDAGDGVEALRLEPHGMEFRWKGIPVRARLWGYHNLLNALGAMAAAECLGLSREEVARGVETAIAPPGRLEEIAHRLPFQVFVDYAHTDGSLETVLRALRQVARGRVITIFGCGGDRDRTKRPRMGRAAEKWSHHIVVTSDNPRSEDPRRILDDIAVGLERPEEAVFEPDRREAIALGIRMARPHDVVLIAGKGHETYQEMQGKKLRFDDREVAREFLAEEEARGRFE